MTSHVACRHLLQADRHEYSVNSQQPRAQAVIELSDEWESTDVGDPAEELLRSPSQPSRKPVSEAAAPGCETMGAQSKPPCARFTGKVAVVTASTAGIGLGIATRLGQEGAKVVICSRKQKNVDDTLSTLRREGIDCQGCACHVGSRDHLKKLVKLAMDSYGRIDVLVSNAAVNPMSGPILDMPEQAIDKILEINVKSAILLCQEVRPHLQRGAAITFISSYTAFNPSTPIPMYAVSKTALLGLTKALAEELGQQGIRVNCVAPGIVPTKFAAALVESPELEQAQKAATLVKRLGRPEDMAAAVAYLCSEDASYVTGETIVVSGGLQSRL